MHQGHPEKNVRGRLVPLIARGEGLSSGLATKSALKIRQWAFGAALRALCVAPADVRWLKKKLLMHTFPRTRFLPMSRLIERVKNTFGLRGREGELDVVLL